MIPAFIMEKLDRIPHLEGNNGGDPRQEYSQWQRWANNNSSSRRSRQHRHVDPRLIKSYDADDLLSEYVDPQAEQHMSFPEPGSFVPRKRKSVPVQVVQKTVPVNSHLYPNPDIIHDYDDDVADLVSLFSSHDPYSSSTSMSLATTILTEDEREEEKLQEPFEMDASLHSLQYSNHSSRRHEDDYHDHNISSVPRKTSGSGSGPGQDLGMTMNDSSLNHLTTILRAKSSLIRQQEAIMRDIEERQAAGLQHQQQQQQQEQQQQQQRRQQQQQEALSSTATAQNALAVDAGFLIQKPETSSTGPVQDPSTKQAVAVATTNIKSNTNTGYSNSTSHQVAASSGDTRNRLDALRRRRVRGIVDETPELLAQAQEKQHQF
jgi:hypothetical protein